MIHQVFAASIKSLSARHLMRKEAAASIGLGFTLILLAAFSAPDGAKAKMPGLSSEYQAVTAPTASSLQDKSNDCPRYCSTDAGILGPYPNPGCMVKVGDPCFGTDNRGQRHEGTAVAERSQPDRGKSEDRERGSSQDDCPRYCSTDAGILGPYANPGCKVKVGDPCFGTDDQGQRREGTAVTGRGKAEQKEPPDKKTGSSRDDCPRYCSTDAGVLGPYQNPGCKVKVGDPCFGTDSQGRRREGTAVIGKAGND